jgi:hypothetical protein
MIQQKNNTTIFHLYSVTKNTRHGFVKRFVEELGGGVAPSTFLGVLTAGEKRFT